MRRARFSEKTGFSGPSSKMSACWLQSVDCHPRRRRHRGQSVVNIVVTILEVGVVLHVPVRLLLRFLHEKKYLLAGGHALDNPCTRQPPLVLVDVILYTEHSPFIFILFKGM